MKRALAFGTILCLVISVLAGASASPVNAQDDPEEKIAALETQVAQLEDKVESLESRVSVLESTGQVPESTEIPVTDSGNTEPTKTENANSSAEPTKEALFGNAFELLPPGNDGELSVVLFGAYDGFTLPVLIRNNTIDELIRVEVSATVRDASGALIAAGGVSDLTPAWVAPGSYAFGSVYFDGAQLPSDAVFEFVVTGSPAASVSFIGQYDLSVEEASYLGDRIVGTAINQHEFSIIGPIGVDAACFSSDGALLGIASDYAQADEVLPGSQIPYQITLFGVASCDLNLVGASEYDF